MHSDPGDYTVVSVRNVSGRAGESESEAPPEILERFEGRTFTLRELEQRGVRIAGGLAFYTANGTDWQLELFPKVE
jgi:hypothetical protein